MKNKNDSLVLVVLLVTNEKNSKNNNQQNQRNRLRSIISNSLSIIDKSKLIDNYRSELIFLTTLYYNALK